MPVFAGRVLAEVAVEDDLEREASHAEEIRSAGLFQAFSQYSCSLLPCELLLDLNPKPCFFLGRRPRLGDAFGAVGMGGRPGEVMGEMFGVEELDVFVLPEEDEEEDA